MEPQELVYASVGGRELKLDLYKPTDAEGPLAAVAYVHGGGWVSGDKRTQYHGTCLLEDGIAVASVGYRLADEARFPAQIHDCKAAVRFLRAEAPALGLRADRIGAWGSSAGGHLVALLGLTGRSRELEGDYGNVTTSSEVQAVADFFGPNDLAAFAEDRGPDWQTNPESPLARLIGGLPSERPEALAAASPVTYVTGDAPPFLLLHGEGDETVPPSQSRILYEALCEAGAEAELVEVKAMAHGWKGMGEETGPERVLGPVRRFFRKHLLEGS
jgi:acetyl esterase/lipase